MNTAMLGIICGLARAGDAHCVACDPTPPTRHNDDDGNVLVMTGKGAL